MVHGVSQQLQMTS